MKFARTILANMAVVAVSIVIGIVLCEVGARVVLNPADYLSVTTLSDDVLGIRIAPNSAGFDAWGFRNPGVPSSADVVTVGDSHTFGNQATMQDAWPSVLARETGDRVYNLGIGGYGPNQYDYLLTTQGVRLHPKVVLCGLYMGDDFENAFSITYGLDHWASLRAERRGTVNANIWDDGEPPGAFKQMRNWLSRESLTYRLLVHGPALNGFKENTRFARAVRGEDPVITAIDLPDAHIREAFRPLGIARRLDQQNPDVKEGMRITFHLLKEMARVCSDNGCTFAVVIIPTKETVFADYLEEAPDLHLKSAVESVIANERVARQRLGEFLDEAQIPYVDTLPALRAAVGDGLYAPTTEDMHPARNGYKVIGDTVAAFTRTLPRGALSQSR
jgi:hypothetical protein